MDHALIDMPSVRDIVRVLTTEHSARDRSHMKNRPSYGISLAIDGEIVYKHKGKRYVSDSEHVVILPKGQSYELECVKSGKFTLFNFQLDMDIELDSFRVIKISKPERILAVHKKAESVFLSHQKSKWMRLLSCFYEIAAIIMEEFEASETPFILKKAMRMIEEQTSNHELSNIWLAKELEISEIYLRKLFGAYLSMSPKQYIQGERIKLAQKLLLGSTYSVSEITERCGYLSESTFCRVFKQKNGVTPTEYRKENKRYFV